MSITTSDLYTKARDVDDKLKEAAIAEVNALLRWGPTIASPATYPFKDGLPTLWAGLVNDSLDQPSVLEAVKNFAKFDTSDYDQAMGFSDGIGLDKLDSEITGVETGTDADNWEGDAVAAFRDNHVVHYRDTTTNQLEVLRRLETVTEDMRTAMEKAYEHLDDLLDDAITALTGIIDGGEGKTASLVLSAIAAAAGIATTVITGGTGAALAGAYVAGGIGVASSTVTTGGTDSVAVGDNTRAGIVALKDRIDEFDGQLAAVLTADIDVVEQLLESSDSPGEDPIEIPRPGFADEPATF